MKKKSLLRATTSLSGMTLLSRVLGFARDVIAAHLFGASAAADVFYFAFRLPNFMRSLFAEGAFQQAFVPVLSEYHAKKTHEEIKTFTQHIAGALSSILIPFACLLILAAPYLVDLFAPGWRHDPFRHSLAVHMLYLMLPYIFFLSLSAFMSAVLNTYGQFMAPAFTSSILNICMILTALFLSPHLGIPIQSQSYAVVLAGITQVAFLAPFMAKIGLLTWPKPSWQDPGVKRVLTLMLPALFGASVGQISLLINNVFASFLPIGSISWLYYSERLAYFPLGVIAVALATVILPHLSRQHANGSNQGFQSALSWGLRWTLLVGTLASVTLWLMAGPMIITLFNSRYGKFNAQDVMMTVQSTAAYAVGLQAFMLNKILLNGFFAKQNIRTPAKIATFIVIINIILNAALVFPFAHAGLALASSLAQWCNTGILFFLLKRHGIYALNKDWLKFMLKLVFANLITGALFYYAAHPVEAWFALSTPLRFLHLFAWLMAGLACYASLLWMLGIRKSDLSHPA